MADGASPPHVPEIAAMRRSYIAEALDGMAYQASGAIRFLERGDDACAERAMARLFDFAREAAAEMKELRKSPAPSFGG